jgi:integrase
MPKLANSLPKYRKHRATGQAVVTLNGRDHYLGPIGTKASKREYDRLIGEWLANDRHPPTGHQSDLKLTELVARYWKHAKGYYRKDGRLTNEISALKCALRPLRELYGEQPVRTFGPLALEAVRGRMIADGWSRTGINRAISRIKRVFRWGVAKELVPSAVFESLRCVDGLRRDRTSARETDPVMPVTDCIIDATLPALPAVVSDMVRVQRLTGMRPAEVCIMRPCDIDRSGDVWAYRPQSHKTQHRGRQRIVPLGPKAQGVLLRYLARDAEAYFFRPCDSEAKRRAEQNQARKTPLSCGNRPGTNRKRRPKRTAGEAYNINSYRRAIQRACDKAGVEKWSPNRLRHTAATAIRREFGLEAAQVILGHSQANVTQVYAERDLAKGVEVARQIG